MHNIYIYIYIYIYVYIYKYSESIVKLCEVLTDV